MWIILFQWYFSTLISSGNVEWASKLFSSSTLFHIQTPTYTHTSDLPAVNYSPTLLTSEQLILSTWGVNALLKGTKLSEAGGEESFTYSFYPVLWLLLVILIIIITTTISIFWHLYAKEVTAPGQEKVRHINTCEKKNLQKRISIIWEWNWQRVCGVQWMFTCKRRLWISSNMIARHLVKSVSSWLAVSISLHPYAQRKMETHTQATKHNQIDVHINR